MVGGGRVEKDSLRICASGEVDELNAVLGLCRAVGADGKLAEILHALQQEIFNLGADLATPLDSKVKVPRVVEDQVVRLENWIDEIETYLEPLRNFILPGGVKLAAQLHLARTVCRRAERAIVRLSTKEEIGAEVVRYVNRLSDLLFVMARWVNLLANEGEELWRATAVRQ